MISSHRVQFVIWDLHSLNGRSNTAYISAMQNLNIPFLLSIFPHDLLHYIFPHIFSPELLFQAVSLQVTLVFPKVLAAVPFALPHLSPPRCSLLNSSGFRYLKQINTKLNIFAKFSNDDPGPICPSVLNRCPTLSWSMFSELSLIIN